MRLLLHKLSAAERKSKANLAMSRSASAFTILECSRTNLSSARWQYLPEPGVIGRVFAGRSPGLWARAPSMACAPLRPKADATAARLPSILTCDK